MLIVTLIIAIANENNILGINYELQSNSTDHARRFTVSDWHTLPHRTGPRNVVHRHPAHKTLNRHANATAHEKAEHRARDLRYPFGRPQERPRSFADDVLSWRVHRAEDVRSLVVQ
jgi:hypothetical protein